MRTSLLAVVMSLMIIATLPLQGFSAAMQRSWVPAHYHAVPDGTLVGEVVKHAQPPPVVHPLDVIAAVITPDAHGHPQTHSDAAPETVTDHGRVRHQHPHPHPVAALESSIAHPHPHPHPHDQPAALTPELASQSTTTQLHPALLPSRAPAPHDHTTAGRHRHHSDDPSVVYVDHPDARSPEPIIRTTGFDNFWTLLPPPLQLISAHVAADPPSMMSASRSSLLASVPLRPPRN